MNMDEYRNAEDKRRKHIGYQFIHSIVIICTDSKKCCLKYSSGLIILKTRTDHQRSPSTPLMVL